MSKGRTLPSKLRRSKVSPKQALEQTFLDIGGVNSLSHWARLNRTEFYRLFANLAKGTTKG